MKPSHLAIGIINYCNWGDTLQCIASLCQQRLCDWIKIDILVVDNNSVDDSVLCIQQELGDKLNVWSIDSDRCFTCKKQSSNANVYLIESQTNGGFAYGNNVCMSFARTLGADYLLWLNNDVVVSDDFCEKMLNSYFALQESIARDKMGMSERQKEANQSKNIERCANKLALSAEERAFDTQQFRHTGFQYLHWLSGLAFGKKLLCCDEYLCGACLLVDIGAPQWNEEFFLYYEDADYAFRLKSAGYQLASTKETCYYHKQGNTTQASGRQRELVLSSMWKYYRLHHIKLLKLVYIIRRLQYRFTGNRLAYRKLVETYKQ